MSPAPRTLVAGIGNVFCGDDGFGVAVVQRLAGRPLGGTVQVRDVGISGLDLAYELLEGYDHVILIDAMPRGHPAGTLSVLEADVESLAAPDQPSSAGHGLGPVQALALARMMGARFRTVRIVGCEPAVLPSDEETMNGLSGPVAAAVEEAARLVEELVTGLHAGR